MNFWPLVEHLGLRARRGRGRRGGRLRRLGAGRAGGRGLARLRGGACATSRRVLRERDFEAVLALARDAGLRFGVAAFAGAAAFAGVAGVGGLRRLGGLGVVRLRGGIGSHVGSSVLRFAGC